LSLEKYTMERNICDWIVHGVFLFFYSAFFKY
jgi:hypothetical protein